jgi:FkbH-like protein
MLDRDIEGAQPDTRSADAKTDTVKVSGSPDLYWLPAPTDFAQRIRAADAMADGAEAWAALAALANTAVDFLKTLRLDRSLTKRFGTAPPPGLATKPIKLAVLGSSTTTQLSPGLRVAALRRGIWVTIYEPDYGQYFQELLDPSSGLHAFRPDAVLFAQDVYHVLREADAGLDKVGATAAAERTAQSLASYWKLAKDAFGCQVIQQTILPIAIELLGNNEHRLPGSAAALSARLNLALRDVADEHGVDLLAVDAWAARDGLKAWHDPVLWHRAKQEISPLAGSRYGELVARMLAARQGRSAKCLVLDLDNTIWGGVIGDDGLDGIILGQGSAAGEAFVQFQAYAKDLTKRGVILAVCSKNDEANAMSAFERHPEMILRRGDIACFVANWTDKATNIRSIAKQLNIGLDALVFVDDNPFERNLVRQELPMVAVPEIPLDPALTAATLRDAGYFEGLTMTEEDRQRSGQYQSNLEREAFQAQSTDLDSYLRGLAMELIWRRFDTVGLQRTAQLINKTNQFNLTTRRYTEDDVQAIMDDPDAFGVQLRLVDRFGDNGIIAIAIGRKTGEDDVLIDTWLMSCRVLGRQVEQATLQLVAGEARRLGSKRLIGEYRPTAKNGMVKEHYRRLGFELLSAAEDGTTQHVLDLTTFDPQPVLMTIREG